MIGYPKHLGRDPKWSAPWADFVKLHSEIIFALGQILLLLCMLGKSYALKWNSHGALVKKLMSVIIPFMHIQSLGSLCPFKYAKVLFIITLPVKHWYMYRPCNFLLDRPFSAYLFSTCKYKLKSWSIKYFGSWVLIFWGFCCETVGVFPSCAVHLCFPKNYFSNSTELIFVAL